MLTWVCHYYLQDWYHWYWGSAFTKAKIERETGCIAVLQEHTNIKKGATRPTYFTISVDIPSVARGKSAVFIKKNKSKNKNYKRGISYFVFSTRTSLSQKCDIKIIVEGTVIHPCIKNSRTVNKKHIVKAVLSWSPEGSPAAAAAVFVCRNVNQSQPVDKQQQDWAVTGLNSAAARRPRALGPLCCQLN